MAPEEIVKQSGLYSANASGVVYSHWHGKTKQLKLTNTLGYLKFNAYVDGNQHSIKAHRFVWWMCCGAIPPGLSINHKNFDRSDNRLANLEVVTHQRNVRHAVEGGKFIFNGWHTVGVGNGRSVLTETKVKNIYWRLLLGESAAKLAREYKVGTTAIYDIGAQKSWRHLWADG